MLISDRPIPLITINIDLLPTITLNITCYALFEQSFELTDLYLTIPFLNSSVFIDQQPDIITMVLSLTSLDLGVMSHLSVVPLVGTCYD